MLGLPAWAVYQNDYHYCQRGWRNSGSCGTWSAYMLLSDWKMWKDM
jgi:hypothetical protein